VTPSSGTDCAAPAAPRPRWRSFALRGLITQVFCLVIALLLWMFSVHRSTFYVEWVHSAAIGGCCWLFIDSARQGIVTLLNRRRLHSGGTEFSDWPGFLWMAACIPVGTIAGYALGHSLGSALSGIESPSLLANKPAAVISFIAAIAATYYFYSIERLRSERAAAESAHRLAVENRLKLLESQLEPHMLFNTLANLRVLIGLDPPRAQAMLDRLIAFLRATLAASQQRVHPLATEFERLSDYLQLMAVRMGPRLQFTLDLPEALRQHPVPPLLLQPLVENAIKHGLEPQVAGGRIGVRAWSQGGRLHIEVRDTGAGLPATPAAASPTGDGSRFGTRQITERLQAMYGSGASFLLAPAADAEGGTLARIELPLSPGGPAAAAASAAARNEDPGPRGTPQPRPNSAP
jgi:two-component sensor histidine kinase